MVSCKAFNKNTPRPHLTLRYPHAQAPHFLSNIKMELLDFKFNIENEM